MRGPLGGLAVGNCWINEGGLRVAAPELPTAAAYGWECGLTVRGLRLSARLHSGFWVDRSGAAAAPPPAAAVEVLVAAPWFLVVVLPADRDWSAAHHLTSACSWRARQV